MPGIAKSAVAGALHAVGVDTAIGCLSGRGRSPLILGYHRVVEDYRSAAEYALPPSLIDIATLERHLDWLGQRYTFVTLDEAAARHGAPHRRGKPVAAITFDDGYRDFYEHAFPVLQRRGIPGAVFVVTDLVGTSRLQAHDELYLLVTRTSGRAASLDILMRAANSAGADPMLLARLRAFKDMPFRVTRVLLENLSQLQLRRVLAVLREQVTVPEECRADLRSLDWATLLKLQRAGVTIGSHTQTHAFLVNEPLDRIVDEITRSKQRAESMLGVPVHHFAYPDGQFDAAVVDVVQEAGYRYAYTTCHHRDSRRPNLTLPRRLLWENSVVNSDGEFSAALMSCQVNGIFDMRRSCRRRHGRR